MIPCKLFTEHNLAPEGLMDFTYYICEFYKINHEAIEFITDVIDNIYE